MQIKKIMKTLSKEIQRLRKILKLCSLKHLSSFWRSFINCEVFLTSPWSENYFLTDITTQAARAAQGHNSARPSINAPTSATFKITDTKFYAPVVTLSTEDDNNFQSN